MLVSHAAPAALFAMAQAVRYKKPRNINVVSITLLALLALGVYLTSQYFPLFLQKQEAYRVLEETGSHLAARKSRYRANPRSLDSLRNRMHNEIRNLGIQDPRSEVWIEIDEHEARLGVIYSQWVEWPMDVIPEQEKVYEMEHVVALD